MADIIIDGTTVINKTGDAITQTFPGPNHTFTVKAVNQPITGATNSTNDNANSDQLAIYNGSTKLWAISEHGYMLNPTKPYFNVYKDDVTSYTTAGPADIVWNQVKSNVTSSYNTSNGRFTAPISGRYFFAFNVLHRGVGYVKGGYAINGTEFYAGSLSEFYVDGNVSGSHQHVTIPMILDLSAGDYVTVNVERNGGDLYFGSNAHNNWIGYLLG